MSTGNRYGWACPRCGSGHDLRMELVGIFLLLSDRDVLVSAQSDTGVVSCLGCGWRGPIDDLGTARNVPKPTDSVWS